MAAAEAASCRPVAYRGMLFEYVIFKQRALDLLRRSKDPMRCMQRMKVRVRDFLGQNFGELKEDLMEKGGGLVSSCQESSAIQSKGLKEELVKEKGVKPLALLLFRIRFSVFTWGNNKVQGKLLCKRFRRI